LSRDIPGVGEETADQCADQQQCTGDRRPSPAMTARPLALGDRLIQIDDVHVVARSRIERLCHPRS
jgi:hypothetical protein